MMPFPLQILCLHDLETRSLYSLMTQKKVFAETQLNAASFVSEHRNSKFTNTPIYTRLDRKWPR